MIVKCERGIYGYFVIILLAILFMFYVYSIKGATILCSTLLQTPIIILLFMLYTSLSRTLYFDECGCTVSCLWYKKVITWDQLKYIRAESYKGRVTYRSPYEKAILFSSKRIHKPNWAKPSAYSLLFPTSFFYVYFLSDPPLKTDALHPRYPLEFCYDQKTFVNQLKEWNIDIENYENVF